VKLESEGTIRAGGNRIKIIFINIEVEEFMRIERGIISGEQLMFLIIGLLQGSTLTGAFVSGITKQNTWVVLLVGFVITLPLLLVYTSLSRKFPHKNLIQINDVIYGDYFGKVISVLYIYFFWFIVPANLRYIGDFFSTYLFTNTDMPVFVIVVILLCMYTIRKGIEVIARFVPVLVIISLIFLIFITIFTLKEMHLSNFLPLFQIDLKDFIQGTNVMVSIPFGEIVVFLMIFPYVNNIKQIKKSAFWGLFIGGFYFIIIILGNIAVLGNIGAIDMIPSYQVARLINVGEIITRMEILIAVTFLFNVFLKICIFYYATVLSIAQLFKLREYKSLIIPIGIISVILSITMYDSPVDEAYAASTYSIHAILFVILIPIISLFIVWIRKLN
jgi:spore germination protein (amino acid permease)